MLEHLAYITALGAPELAEAASDVASNAVKKLGSQLAAGICEELTARARQELLGASRNWAGVLFPVLEATAEDLTSSLETRLADALASRHLSVVPLEELSLLRELAATAVSNGDVSAVVAKLTAFYRQASTDT